MNEDDLLKGARAAALPNGMEAGLVSHAMPHDRGRHPNFDLQVSGKITEYDRFAMVFGLLSPVPCEEEDDDDDIDAVGESQLFTSELLKRELPVEVI